MRDDDRQAETSCFAGAPCIHVGERLTSRLDGVGSCEGVVASDALSAFRWRCVVEDGTAMIYSDGLDEALAALVTPAG